jgi:hypothetical protein
MEIQAQNSSTGPLAPIRPRSHFTLRFFKCHFIRLRPPTQCKKRVLTSVLRKIKRKKMAIRGSETRRINVPPKKQQTR